MSVFTRGLAFLHACGYFGMDGSGWREPRVNRIGIEIEIEIEINLACRCEGRVLCACIRTPNVRGCARYSVYILDWWFSKSMVVVWPVERYWMMSVIFRTQKSEASSRSWKDDLRRLELDSFRVGATVDDHCSWVRS